jgi:cation diffusion facilitator CzcD-associated flavoprotein CzcO
MYTITSDFLVSGVGQLNSPKYPDIPGLDSFKGKLIHSARWDWSYNLAGKRVAIIGNGATAAQIIPEVTKVASSVTVFQRTPNWVVPRDDALIPQWKRSLYKNIPLARKRHRAELMDMRESFFFNAIVTSDANGKETLRDLSLALMERQMPNKQHLIPKLIPNYPPGCKRVIISDDLFLAYDKPHVFLETDKIECITADGIKTQNTQYEVDMIVCATGFRTVEFMYPIKIYGLGGRSIEDIWRGGARAYLGVTVESLPNFGILYGPNTNLGHNSIILMIEAQSHYIAELVRRVGDATSQNQSLVISPTPAATKKFNSELQEALSTSTFAHPDCNSWYKTDVGLITNNWSGTVVDYQKRLSSIAWSDYTISGSYAKELHKVRSTYIGRIQEETNLGRISLGALSLPVLGLALLLMQRSVMAF